MVELTQIHRKLYTFVLSISDIQQNTDIVEAFMNLLSQVSLYPAIPTAIDNDANSKHFLQCFTFSQHFFYFCLFKVARLRSYFP